MSFRSIVFWAHLTVGLTAGLVIALLCATGVVLAFERPLVSLVESGGAAPAGEPGGRSLVELAAEARAAMPGAELASLSLWSDGRPAVFAFGPRGAVLADAERGVLLGPGANRLRAFFASVTGLHRWLLLDGRLRDRGKAVTGAANLGFFALALSGLVLWWPRRRTRSAFAAVAVPYLSPGGWRRDWNWHHVAGFWCAPVLLVVTASGAVISYAWANALVFAVAGGTPPARAERGGDAHGEAPVPALDALVAAAAERAPGWRAITVRMPKAGEARATVLVEEAGAPHLFARGTLVADAATGAVERWEPWAGLERGRRARSWMRGLHTGEALGAPGSAVAAVASAAGTVLVWTGVALAWRRFRGRRD